ncbi:MAG: GSU2403 family nucleotidyltransferase fold protein [Candidatus Kaelpia imicola]|nr:GSU2403 family nucleotidyltransferase fold protein [Candidatus Kaelpia imicola]
MSLLFKDFLIPTPSKIKVGTNIPRLLKDLGFIVGFKGREGYIQLEHPDLIVEFLVPEKGYGLNKPYQLPQFGLNAQALRFLNLLIQDTIKVKIEGAEITLPHSANFALHKLIILQRRTKEERIIKDRSTAIEILRALISKGETVIIKCLFNSMIPKWQNKVIKGLKEIQEKEILNLLDLSIKR